VYWTLPSASRVIERLGIEHVQAVQLARSAQRQCPAATGTHGQSARDGELRPPHDRHRIEHGDPVHLGAKTRHIDGEAIAADRAAIDHAGQVQALDTGYVDRGARVVQRSRKLNLRRRVAADGPQPGRRGRHVEVEHGADDIDDAGVDEAGRHRVGGQLARPRRKFTHFHVSAGVQGDRAGVAERARIRARGVDVEQVVHREHRRRIGDGQREQVDGIAFGDGLRRRPADQRIVAAAGNPAGGGPIHQPLTGGIPGTGTATPGKACHCPNVPFPVYTGSLRPAD
jgi:hypothetical protein